MCATQGALRADRVPNTTLRFPLAPPKLGYSLVDAFPGVRFNEPVGFATPPGETNRLFILEKAGNVVVITNLAAPTRTVFMTLPVLSDSESGLLGLAFHPGYATNRLFFLSTTRNLTTARGTGRHQGISRFECSPTNPNQGLPSTEVSLIQQYDTAGNHQGGDIHFGPDGYLYASVGDEGPQYDGGNNSQTITKNFFSAILRIDADKRPGNLLPNPHASSTTNYFVPADNPWVGATSFNGTAVDPAKVRTEFYAVGFRNPWRMSFDSLTGQLYVGDVGQDLWEWVDLVVKGGNYGWAYFEGLHAGPKTAPAGFKRTNPIHEYPHGSGTTRGNAIIGGVVYRGKRFSQLYGAYVFSDNTTGNVWMMRPNGTNYVTSQRIGGAASPAAIGVDSSNGDVLIAQLGGQILRLTYDATPVGAPLPATLSAAGVFADLNSLTPQPGILPYELNVPFWSDGAIKRRWFSVPDVAAKMVFNREGNWQFPQGSVWVKHFDLELTNGVPESRRRLETRVIVKTTNDIYGVTYRWDDAQKEATLVPEAGLDESFVIRDGGIVRTQVWHYPSRSECLTCHTSAGGWALGFSTAQLNRDVNFGTGIENQIQALSRAGYFTEPISGLNTLRALVPAGDTSASVESRVRSYLAANCSQCHQPGGPTPAAFDTRISTPTRLAGLIRGMLSASGSDSSRRVLVPGAPELSVMLEKISKRGPGQMPPIGSTVIDASAVQLLTEWIRGESTAFREISEWQTSVFGDATIPTAALGVDADQDGANNELEFLTGTDPKNPNDVWRVSARLGATGVQIRFSQIAGRGFEVQVSSDLKNPASWQPLDVPSNRPTFSAVTHEAVVEDPASASASGPRFYRVRVFEP
jgi:uncharacterized repeat protein (TIGR03806 family)